jgi:coenzyme F420-reducing hydrogenase alpha subunit
MRSAYVIKIELNTKLILTDLEDNRVSINGVVCATLQNQKCMDQLIPMISQKVMESIKPTLKKMVDDSLLPHIEKIQSAHHVINLQTEEIDKQNTIISFEFFLITEDHCSLSVAEEPDNN